MRKSTLLFVSVNVLILLIPLLLMMGLRWKIKSGDIIDQKAIDEARYFNDYTIGNIETIVLNGQYRGIILSIEMDTIDRISMDTSTARYVKYKIENGVFTVDYNFKKDSTENKIEFKDTEVESAYSNDPRVLIIHTRSSPRKIIAEEAIVNFHLSEKNLIRNDLELTIRDCELSFMNAGRDSDYYVEDNLITRDSLPYTVNLNLRNSELSFGLYYVKNLKLEIRNSRIDNFVHNFDRMEVSIDDSTSLQVDINQLRKMKINYLK